MDRMGIAKGHCSSTPDCAPGRGHHSRWIGQTVVADGAAQTSSCLQGHRLIGTGAYERGLVGQRGAVFIGAQIQTAVAGTRSAVDMPDIFRNGNTGMRNATSIQVDGRIRTDISTRGRRSQIIISQQSVYKPGDVPLIVLPNPGGLAAVLGIQLLLPLTRDSYPVCTIVSLP